MNTDRIMKPVGIIEIIAGAILLIGSIAATIVSQGFNGYGALIIIGAIVDAAFLALLGIIHFKKIRPAVISITVKPCSFKDKADTIFNTLLSINLSLYVLELLAANIFIFCLSFPFTIAAISIPPVAFLVQNTISLLLNYWHEKDYLFIAQAQAAISLDSKIQLGASDNLENPLNPIQPEVPPKPIDPHPIQSENPPKPIRPTVPPKPAKPTSPIKKYFYVGQSVMIIKEVISTSGIKIPTKTQGTIKSIVGDHYTVAFTIDGHLALTTIEGDSLQKSEASD